MSSGEPTTPNLDNHRFKLSLDVQKSDVGQRTFHVGALDLHIDQEVVEVEVGASRIRLGLDRCIRLVGDYIVLILMRVVKESHSLLHQDLQRALNALRVG